MFFFFFFSCSIASESKMAIEKKNGTWEKKFGGPCGKFPACHQFVETLSLSNKGIFQNLV